MIENSNELKKEIVPGTYLQKKDSKEFYALLEDKVTLWGAIDSLYGVVCLEPVQQIYAMSGHNINNDFIVVDKNAHLDSLFFDFLATQYGNKGEFYYRIKRSCQHNLVESSYGSADCNICGEDLGWYCPDSPDHTCYYSSNHATGMIELRNGTEVKVPDPDHDPSYETYDDCLFCHQPDERK